MDEVIAYRVYLATDELGSGLLGLSFVTSVRWRVWEFGSRAK